MKESVFIINKLNVINKYSLVLLACGLVSNSFAQKNIPDATVFSQEQNQNNHAKTPSQASTAPSQISPSLPTMADQSIVTGETTPSSESNRPVGNRVGNLSGGAQTLYTWTDSKGITHVTNTPPSDIILDQFKKDPTKIKITNTNTTNSKSLTATEQLKQLDKEKTEKVEKDKKEKESGAEKAQKAVYCDQLKVRLNAYKNAPKITVPGSDGKPQAIDDATRAASLQTIQDSYTSVCE